MKGKVKFLTKLKAFGFIVSDDGKEYFVHQTGLEPGVSLNENDVVTFDVVDGDRGPKADHVKKATGGKSAPADDDDMMSDDDDE